MNNSDTVALETPAFQKASMPATTVAFIEIYELETTKPIEFESSWGNGTGYYDRAVDVQVPPGEVHKSYDPRTCRKLLLVGTREGTVVVFERHSDGARGVYVSNWPRKLTSLRNSLRANSALSSETIGSIIGSGYGMFLNVGQLLEQLTRDAIAAQKK